MTARPSFIVSGTKATGDVPTVQVDGSVAWAAASGGSSPDPATLARGGYDASPTTTVPSGSNLPIAIEYGFGDQVLDVTDPTQPVVATAGIYSVWVEVYGEGGESSNPSCSLNMGVDVNNDFGYAPNQGPCSNTQSVVMGLTYYCRAGSVISVTVGQNSGVDKHYKCVLVIQRIA